MNKQLTIFSASLLFCAALAYSVVSKPHSASPKNFALVEYFTSDACYRCPPADELVSQVAKEYADKEVYVLAYHVDYRNDSLWKDVFSQPSFSERQRRYGRRFKLFSVYTPQVIVNGKKELLGSDKSLLYSSLRTALKDTAASNIELSIVSHKRDSVTISYKAGAYKENLLNLALVQKAFQQKVDRGANRGKLMQYNNIVRDLLTISFIGKKEGTATIAIPPGLSLNDIKLIGFVQNRATLAITSATAITPVN